MDVWPGLFEPFDEASGVASPLMGAVYQPVFAIFR
jgi:hypothetical protein